MKPEAPFDNTEKLPLDANADAVDAVDVVADAAESGELLAFLNLSVGSVNDLFLKQLALTVAQSKSQILANLEAKYQQLTSIETALRDEQTKLELERTILAQEHAALERMKTGLEQKKTSPVKPKKEVLIDGRYLVSGVGTVIDQKTKLMWMQLPLAGMFTYDKALEACKKLNAEGGFAEYSDWRVPNKDELASLVIQGRSPAICQDAFPDTPNSFWTSSPYEDGSTYAWLVSFTNGNVYPLNRGNYSGHVRLVRDSVSGGVQVPPWNNDAPTQEDDNDQ